MQNRPVLKVFLKMKLLKIIMEKNGMALDNIPIQSLMMKQIRLRGQLQVCIFGMRLGVRY